ncbi:UNVERIFIED_CONTAM: Retrovirus-related Pol polyprotein from transposon TNT 1-94 [Sesamum calycinum]|uniref:Retrovirus-related Pol polyprotein from transposon TNT 1-94 n=1 Tax=Sesamum calycinum TaxID=2727403 RepID=A0AAW2J102_9LAMI
MWHARLGHISQDRKKRLVDSTSLEIDNLDNLPACESGLKGKMTKKPFVGQSKLANGLLDLIHTDVCGPLNTQARGGFSYLLTFTDDHSRYGYVYLMRYKSEAFVRFKEFRLEVENQTGRKIKILRSDRGGEYLSAPSKTVAQTPYQIWHGKPASYKYLRVWGSPAYVKRLVGDKLDSRSSLCRFIGYPKETAGYYFYDPTEQKVFVSRNAVFLERGQLECHNLLRGMVFRRDRDLYGSAGGIHGSREEQKVCHLQRSIYGLMQAFRSWNIRFDEVIRGYDFVKNDFDPCVYKKVSGSSVLFLVLYVDDILLIGNDIKILGDSKAWLSTQFSMNDLSEASYILGITIFRDRSKRILGMTQNSYVWKVLKRFKMEHSKRGFLLMRHGVKLSKKQSPKTDEELKRMLDIPYASAVGSIQYVAQCTRPDIAYALSVTSRYQACAGEAHWTAVKTILQYLRRTKDVFLVYGGGELILEGFSDASFQSDDDDAKSQSGFVFKLNGGVVAWKSSKHDTTADSTTEAEYIAASEAAKEAV